MSRRSFRTPVRVRSLSLVALAVSVGVATLAGGAVAATGARAAHAALGAPGGTLTYYMYSPFQTDDPQRIYYGNELGIMNRTVYRSLVAFPNPDSGLPVTTPVPDLATTTGTSTDDAKTWSFTLKDDVTWQDGSAITCGDLRYGASRDFATDVITGGPNYLLTYLDIPTDPKTRLPIYTGPYQSSPAGVAAFDKAITCAGQTITYHFKKAWPDFPQAIAALGMTDPFKASIDKGEDSNWTVFSDGPYEISGKTTWEQFDNATFVRNPNYHAPTDSPNIRAALPDKIVFHLDDTAEHVVKVLVADKGAARTAVTSGSVLPYLSDLVTKSAEARATKIASPYVDYLAPNFKKLKNPTVRRALALATNKHAWIAAGGGSNAYKSAVSVVNPAVPGYKANPSFKNIPGSGDLAAAKHLLRKAKVHLPYPITFTYPQGITMDMMAAALKHSWNKAGFKTKLHAVSEDDYFFGIENPDQTASVVWAGWGSDWPSAITVTPPLFDSRPNLSRASNGQDYGRYQNAAFNALVDQAEAASSPAARNALLQKADAILGKDTAYIPLDIPKFYFLRGSGVTGYSTSLATSSYPDLGSIGVVQ